MLSGSTLNAPAGVLVEADGEAEVGGAGPDRAIGHRQGAAAGGAAVPDVDERQAGEPQLVHEGVGVATVAAAAEGELGLVPPDPGVGQRQPGGVHRLLASRHAVGAAEGVDADADDGDAVRIAAHARAPNAKVTTSVPSARVVNGTTTSSTGMPISSWSGSAVVRRDSTITSSASST